MLFHFIRPTRFVASGIENDGEQLCDSRVIHDTIHVKAKNKKKNYMILRIQGQFNAPTFCTFKTQNIYEKVNFYQSKIACFILLDELFKY